MTLTVLEYELLVEHLRDRTDPCTPLARDIAVRNLHWTLAGGWDPDSDAGGATETCCAICDLPFSGRFVGLAWEDRHTLTDGTDCHPDCCPDPRCKP